MPPVQPTVVSIAGEVHPKFLDLAYTIFRLVLDTSETKASAAIVSFGHHLEPDSF